MQDRLFGAEEMLAAATSSPILAFDPTRKSNGHRVLDLATLGYLPEPVLDPTYGLGKMWTHHQPACLVGTDLNPDRARDTIADFCALPFRDNSFASSLFDPPYKLGGDDTYDRSTPTDPKRRHNDLSNRYAVNAGREQGVWELIEAGMTECFRVTTGFVIVKCQDQIHHGFEFQTARVGDIAARRCWRVEDMVHLENSISQPPGTPQHHARRNYSTHMVLVPSRRS